MRRNSTESCCEEIVVRKKVVAKDEIVAYRDLGGGKVNIMKFPANPDMVALNELVEPRLLPRLVSIQFTCQVIVNQVTECNLFK